MKLAAALPKSDDRNGLAPYAQQLAANPMKEIVIVAVVDCATVLHDVDADEDVPTARIRRVEVLTKADADLARDLLKRTNDARMGRPPTLDLRTATGLHITRNADTA